MTSRLISSRSGIWKLTFCPLTRTYTEFVRTSHGGLDSKWRLADGKKIPKHVRRRLLSKIWEVRRVREELEHWEPSSSETSTSSEALRRHQIFVWDEYQLVPANIYRKVNCPSAEIHVSSNPPKDRDDVIRSGGTAIVYDF